MRISGLQVDRFGILNGFQVENLSDGITVFHGANEAGKTTLLQFVRTMLYGFGSDRSKRYLEMQHNSGILASGSRIGGSLYLSAREDDYHIRRYSSLTDTSNVTGELRVTGREGTRQGAHRLNTLLAGIDETIFNNVFAVGLREMQYLGTLNDTQAARYLYNLSTGTDRVSLVDVMRQLNATRARLLGTLNEPGYLAELAEQSDRGMVKIQQLARSTDRWAQMRSELGRLEDEIRGIESNRSKLQRKLRLAELTLRVRPDWERRLELDARLEALGPPIEISSSKRQRLVELKQEVEVQQARLEELSKQRGDLQTQLDKLRVGRESVRNRVRLEALLDQRSAIASLDDRVQRLRTEKDEIEFEIQAERERLDIGDTADAGNFNTAQLAALREPAREMERDRERLEAAKQESSKHKELVEVARRDLADALGKNKEWFDESDRRDVAEAIGRTEETAALLRRRLGHQQTLANLEAEFKAISDRRKRQLANQLLPWEVIRAMGALFTVGAFLLLCALFGQWMGISQDTRIGFTIMGLVLTGFVGLLKMTLDGSSRDELADTETRLNDVEMEFQAAEEALDQIDARIPGLKGRTLTLADVEERLHRLESLIPLDNQRRQAADAAERAEKRAIQLAMQLKNARERWTESLQHLGLSPRLTPQQVWKLVGEAGNLSSLNQRLAQLEAQLEQSEGELSVFAKRIAGTASELRLASAGERPSELLVQLANHAAGQKQKALQADQLSQRDRELKKKHRDETRELQRLQRQQHAMLSGMGVVDEEELERVIAGAKERQQLQEQRGRVASRIAEVCGKELDESTVSQQLYSVSGESLDQRIKSTKQQLEEQDSRLKKLLVRQGQLSEQVRAMTNERELGLAHLNQAIVENSLARGTEQLKIVSSMAGMLKHVYKRYEKERQPETLQNASIHFRHMTADRYLRIWTPLDDDVLMVDDEHGKSVSVDQLSRGTREQVFLALRLALISGYSGRGQRMPLVLDDVLVNFDQIRTQAAAEVLVDFAQTGGQVLLFTCHEHVADMFRDMGVDVRELPSRAGPLDVTQQPHEREMQVERAVLPAAPPKKRRRNTPGRLLIGFEDPDDTDVAQIPERESDGLDQPAIATGAPAAVGAGVASLYALQLDDSLPSPPADSLSPMLAEPETLAHHWRQTATSGNDSREHTHGGGDDSAFRFASQLTDNSATYPPSATSADTLAAPSDIDAWPDLDDGTRHDELQPVPIDSDREENSRSIEPPPPPIEAAAPMTFDAEAPPMDSAEAAAEFSIEPVAEAQVEEFSPSDIDVEETPDVDVLDAVDLSAQIHETNVEDSVGQIVEVEDEYEIIEEEDELAEVNEVDGDEDQENEDEEDDEYEYVYEDEEEGVAGDEVVDAHDVIVVEEEEDEDLAEEEEDEDLAEGEEDEDVVDEDDVEYEYVEVDAEGEDDAEDDEYEYEYEEVEEDEDEEAT